VLREELRVAIITWIERTYHHRRRQRALGKLTPVEYGAVIGYNRLTQAA
jgi:putative transposase